MNYGLFSTYHFYHYIIYYFILFNGKLEIEILSSLNAFPYTLGML